MKEILKNYLAALAGYHDVGDIINPDIIRDRAVPYQAKNENLWWFSLPAKPGVYLFEQNNKLYYLCRTRIGFLFPSLYRLDLIPNPILIPHPIRLVFGYFFVFFMVVATIITSVLVVTQFPQGLVAIGFWALTFLVFEVFVGIEKNLAAYGFKKYISNI